jgi:mRNA interferase RelE/StbE
MKVAFRQSFQRDVKKLKNKAVRKRVEEMVDKAEEAETLDELSALKKMAGHDKYYRIRIGEPNRRRHRKGHG